jgi:serine/threonine protein kinase
MLTSEQIRKRFIGKVLGGRYRLLDLIGHGGMGAVFRATDPQLERDVALKVMSADDVEDRERHRKRFQREAQLAARIRHPNVVVVHDFGTDPNADPGAELDYIVMELLPGEDLAKWLPRLRDDMALSVNVLAQAARGVAAGHRKKIVHRDVKPRNLVISPGESPQEVEVHVVDFGIAKSYVNTGDPTDTTGHGFISAKYASPEHLQKSTSPTPQWDVFSLGVVAYEVLAGSHPFTDDDRTRLAQKLPVQVRSPRTLNPAIPPAVEAVILQCLALDPSSRYPDARALTVALEQAWAASAPPAPVVTDRTEGTLRPADRTEVDLTAPHTDPVPANEEKDPGPAGEASRGNPGVAEPVGGGPAAVAADGGGDAGHGGGVPLEDRRQNAAQPRPEPWRPGTRAWAWAAAVGIACLLAFSVFGGPGAVVGWARAAKAYLARPGEIRLDQPISGMLEEGDSSTAAGKSYDVFAFHGEKGEPLTFALDSAAFDPVLEWTHRENGEWKTLESSSGTHPQLHVTLRDTSEYRLRVRAARQGGRGRYLVTPRRGSPALSPGRTLPSQLTAGDTRLVAGVWSERWMLSARPGSRLTVTVHPRTFRANVQWWQADVGEPEMVERAMSDSPGGDATLTVTVPESGEYYLQVQNRDSSRAGWYNITATTAARELRPGSPATSWLTRADSDAAGGLVSEQWIYRGTPGEPVMIWLRSRRRMMLEWWHLVGAQWTELKAVSTDGAMLVRPTATGEYYLRVRGATPDETGAYTIEPIAQPIVGTIGGNQTVTGTLDASDSLGNGTYAELWSLSGTPGEQVSIAMVAGGLYPALSFGCWTADGVWQKIHEDAPAYPGYARVDALVGGTGDCAIRAASAAPWGGTGAYNLSVYVPAPGFAPKM